MRFWKRKKESETSLAAGESDAESEIPAEEEFPAEAPADEARPEPEREKLPSFFDMSAEEAVDYVPPGAVIARKEPANLKPLLWYLAAAVLVAGVIVGVALLWPSSKAPVPELSGTRLADAMEQARSSGFEPEVVGWEFSEEHDDGVVVSQKPRAETVVEKGSVVALTVSKGPQSGVEYEKSSVKATEITETEEGREAPSHPFQGKTVCIDPGHQVDAGESEWLDPGMTRMTKMEVFARGVITGNAEYVVTMDLGAKLKGLLEKDGMEVVMTRESDDVDLSNVSRAEIANRAEADLCVRIHCGKSGNEAESGTATYYPEKTEWTESVYENSKTAALFVQEEMVRSCSTTDLGVFGRDDLAGFNWSKVPVIEVEVAFLSNPDEDALMSTDDFRWKIAWGLRNGVIKYFTDG